MSFEKNGRFPTSGRDMKVNRDQNEPFGFVAFLRDLVIIGSSVPKIPIILSKYWEISRFESNLYQILFQSIVLLLPFCENLVNIFVLFCFYTATTRKNSIVTKGSSIFFRHLSRLIRLEKMMKKYM